jgi:hypothetical protein
MNTHRNLIVGLAGAFAVTVAHFVTQVLGDKLSVVGAAFIITAIALLTYATSFVLIDGLYEKVIWPTFARRNLTGQWKMELTNLADGSTRTGEAHIIHSPSLLRISCVNHRPGVAGAYSSWTSVLATFVDETTLLFIYQVESAVDTKPFKRGVMRLQVNVTAPKVMTGDFFDNAPSDDRGPVVFRRES